MEIIEKTITETALANISRDLNDPLVRVILHLERDPKSKGTDKL